MILATCRREKSQVPTWHTTRTLDYQTGGKPRVSTDYQSLDLSLSEECVADPARGQPNFLNSMSIGDCALALRHSTIIFCTRTQGHGNQHGMGEGIMGQDRCEWTSIPNFFSGARRKLNDVVPPHVLI
jgi:hypothetical protein